MTNPDFCYVIFSFAFPLEFQPTFVFYYRVILVIIVCIERFTLPVTGKMIHFDVLNFLYSAVLSIIENQYDSRHFNSQNSFYMKVHQRDKIVNHFKFRRLWPTFESGWQHQSCITESPSSRHQFYNTPSIDSLFIKYFKRDKMKFQIFAAAISSTYAIRKRFNYQNKMYANESFEMILLLSLIMQAAA